MASSVRFLHCAGFRFDSPSWEGPEGWVSQRKQDLWHTFEAILSLCRSEKIDFLFIVGNLFEQEYVHKETVERVLRSFAELEGTRIFIVPGERDPLVSTSAYRLVVWPSNVHIFLGGINSVKIPSHNVTVYGAGWTAFQQEESFLDGFQTTRDGTFKLMLLHAKVDSTKYINGNISILPEQIATSGLDYLALGYQEVWSGIQQAGKTFWADCGSAEARGFSESSQQGVLLGEIEEESVRFEFRELGQRRYVKKTLSIQSDMEGLVTKLLAETDPQERQKDLFRVMLSGPFREAEAEVQTLQKLLAEKFRYVEVIPNDRLLSQFGSDMVGTAESMVSNSDGYPTLTQVFVDKINKALFIAENTENNEYWELVQKIGLAALGQGRYDNEN